MSNNINVKEFGAKVLALQDHSATSLQNHRRDMRKFWMKNAEFMYNHASDDKEMTKQLNKLFHKYPDVYKPKRNKDDAEMNDESQEIPSFHSDFIVSKEDQIKNDNNVKIL